MTTEQYMYAAVSFSPGHWFAIALLLVGILLDKPITIYVLLVLFVASLIYPVLHFVRRTRWRVAAFASLILVGLCGGILEWTSKKPPHLPPSETSIIKMGDHSEVSGTTIKDSIVNATDGDATVIKGGDHMNLKNLDIHDMYINPTPEQSEAFRKKLKADADNKAAAAKH